MSFQFISTVGFGGGLAFTLVFALLFIACFAALIWLLYKFFETKSQKTKMTVMILGLIIGAGLLLRVIISFISRGYREDYFIFTDTVNFLATENMTNYYLAGKTLYPLTFIIYAIFGGFANLTSMASNETLMQFIIRLPLIICDCVSAFIIYKAACKYINHNIGLVLAGFIMVCPIFIMLSAVWTSVYSILMLTLTLSVYFLAQKKYLGVFVSFGAAMLVSFEAVYLFLVPAVFMIYHMIRAFIQIKRTKTPFKKILFQADTALAIKIPLYFVICFIGGWLISLIMFAKVSANPFVWLYRFFLEPIGNPQYFSYNGLSIYSIFARNGVMLSSNFPTALFAILFAALILGVILLVYLSRRNRANLVILAAYILTSVSVYYIGSNALSLCLPLGIMLMAFIFTREKRIIKIFALIGFFTLLNSCMVMLSAGYFNNYDQSVFTANAYTGSVLLSGGYLAINIVLCILTLLTHLYFTLVILDIAVSNKRKVLKYIPDCTFNKAIKEFIKTKEN